MRPCVADTVRRGEVVWQISIARTRIPGKLQHLHAREAGRGHQLPDLIRDDTEVLRDDRQVLRTEVLVHRAEQSHARALHPRAVFRRVITERHRVVGLKAPEMIDAETVVHREAVLHARTPPGVLRLLMRRPVIERVAPELTTRREGIWRNSRYLRRMAVLRVLEELAMRPDI